MFLAPLSEFFGRRYIYLTSFTLFILFLIPCAAATNIQTLLIARFLNGFAGSAFLSVAGGSVGDMWAGRDLGGPMMLYTASPFVGPVVGPLIGGYVNQNISWRWTYYILIIWAFLQLGLLFFFVPETYHPVLLRNKARRLRATTGDERYFTPIEKLSRTIPATIAISCLRPFQLLFFEPMVLLLCTLTAVLLGILYLFFQGFPLVFGNVYGMSLQEVGLTFLGLFVGMLLGTLTDPYWRSIYTKLVKQHSHPAPEFRLPPAIFGSVLVPIGLFIFAFTTGVSGGHWIFPIIGSALFATGTLLVFTGVFTFLVDAYPLYAASALAANSFMRSSFAAGFPLFSYRLYDSLGYQWGTGLLAFLTLGLMPFP